MQRLRFFVTALAVATAVAFRPGALAAQGNANADARVDLTGTWQLSVTTGAGTGTPTITLKQQGDSLTGHYSSQVLGEAELAGTVKADKVTFVVKVSMQGTAFDVTYSGTVESKDAMKG